MQYGWSENAAHPQVAFQLTDSLRLWKKKVWAMRLKPSPPENLKNLRIGKKGRNS
jgi:hypothetical protein